MFALRKLEFRTVTVATSIFLSNYIILNKVLTNYCYDIGSNANSFECIIISQSWLSRWFGCHYGNLSAYAHWVIVQSRKSNTVLFCAVIFLVKFTCR